MSQSAVERLLGRLVTDREFRRRFYVEPVVACRLGAIDVTSRELEAVLGTDDTHFDVLAQKLDARIVRATMVRPSIQLATAGNLVAMRRRTAGAKRDARNHRRKSNRLRKH